MSGSSIKQRFSASSFCCITKIHFDATWEKELRVSHKQDFIIDRRIYCMELISQSTNDPSWDLKGFPNKRLMSLVRSKNIVFISSWKMKRKIASLIFIYDNGEHAVYWEYGEIFLNQKVPIKWRICCWFLDQICRDVPVPLIGNGLATIVFTPSQWFSESDRLINTIGYLN